MNDPRDAWREALAATPDCIALERFGEPLTAAEREHLATCARCQSELALYESFASDEAAPEETRAGAWVAAELHRRLDGAANVTAFEPRRRAPRFAWAAAAAAVFVIGTGLWMEKREPSLGDAGVTSVYRTARLDAIAPLGDLAAAPRELRWNAVAGATVYTVEITEVDRTLLWRSETSSTRIVLPPNVVAQCAPGKTLLWDVAARRGSDELASSGVQQFRVAVPVPGR